MSISLYSAVVPPFQQILKSMGHLLKKADAYCHEARVNEETLLQQRLHPDMLDFAYQIKSTAVHSIGAIEGVRRGRFAPDRSAPGTCIADLIDRISDAQTKLAQVDVAECETFVGKAMRFELPRHFAEFTGESFLLHFSLPNFYFHAATAYDILRAEGVPLGKVDYIGQLSLHRSS